jgi:CheY-like chemotaxis protein/two-component sensor histidine kinase
VEGFDSTERTLAIAALRDADRRKDEFLAMLAHELRNPLAPIRTAAELITRRAGGDETIQRGAEIVRRQSAQLSRLVDDLLDVSRISRGHVELKCEILSLSQIIEHAVETVMPLARAKHQEISWDPAIGPVHVNGDHARLVQVFANILTNAAKYTEPGGRIGIRVDASDELVQVHISDNGTGIAPEFMPHLFEMFAQADRTLDRSQGGLGIGLPVVKRLVDMHGGKIAARSEGLGRGSVFTISLPRAEGPRTTAVPVASDAGPARRILIVDDNADAGTSLGALLQLDGHETQTAFSSLDALQLAQSFSPDIVLLDIGLPEMDGYEVARRLRQFPHGQRINIIALTGYGQEEDRKRAQDAGFDAHLVKPLDFTALGKLLAESQRT